MRILNRPMFRYGGPIKEGIMHGVRSNYANGRRAALVGDPVFPRDSSGRSHHALPVAYGIGAGLLHGARMALPWAARMGSRYLKPLFGRTVPTTQKVMSANPMSATTGGTSIYKNIAGTPKFNPNWLGRDPVVRTVGAAGKAIFNPTVGGWAGKAARFATSPSSIIAGVAYYMWPDGKERKTPPPQSMKDGPPGGGETSLGSRAAYYKAPPKTKSAAELAAEAKAARTKKLNKYLDTMGYDKAKKTALGDALIDASAIVQGDVDEAGSLKKADWGRMINKAIQTTSKRLDKPEQIREAVGLMMTKADIEKDMNAEKNALDKLAKTLQIKGYEKQLAGETLQESINAAYQRTGKFPTGSTLAGVARTKGIEVTKVIPTTEIPDDMSAIDYISIITEKAKKDGNPMPKGHYVIKDRLVEIDESGDIIKQLI